MKSSLVFYKGRMVSYLLRMFHYAQKNQIRYKVVVDHLHCLEVEDLITKKHFFKKPTDILSDNTYTEYSKDDVMRIGFICGQIACSRSVM